MEKENFQVIGKRNRFAFNTTPVDSMMFDFKVNIRWYYYPTNKSHYLIQIMIGKGRNVQIMANSEKKKESLGAQVANR